MSVFLPMRLVLTLEVWNLASGGGIRLRNNHGATLITQDSLLKMVNDANGESKNTQYTVPKIINYLKDLKFQFVFELLLQPELEIKKVQSGIFYTGLISPVNSYSNTVSLLVGLWSNVVPSVVVCSAKA